MVGYEIYISGEAFGSHLRSLIKECECGCDKLALPCSICPIEAEIDLSNAFLYNLIVLKVNFLLREHLCLYSRTLFASSCAEIYDSRGFFLD